MTDLILRWLEAGQTPLLAIIAIIVWKIKTNDLPHITERLSLLEGWNTKEDKRTAKLRRR